MTNDLHLSLLASPSAAGLARTLITQRLTKWGYQHLTDDAVLIATELVVNASEATPHEQIKLRLGRNTRGIFLAVWDGSPALPRPSPPLTSPSTLSTPPTKPSTTAAAGAST
jgi:hypothetical protein